MSDKEDTPASLRDGSREAVHSDVLSVQHPPGDAIPEFLKPPDEGSESPSAVGRQRTGDVFPADPSGTSEGGQFDKGERKASSRVAKAATESSDGEGLARRPPDEEVDLREVERGVRFDEVSEVAMVLHLRVVVLEEVIAEWVDFREPRGLPAERLPRY
jgi:hypothetical protein